MKARRVVGLMVLALLAYLSPATAAEPSKGEKIVADATLFGAETAEALATRVGLVLSMPRGAMAAGWPVPDPQPSIKDVQRKYGKADKVENRKKSDNMPEDSAVHWYGRVGLAVATGDSTGKVFWVLAEQDFDLKMRPTPCPLQLLDLLLQFRQRTSLPGIKHEARFERESGSFRPIVKDVVEKYLGPCLPDVADARQRLAGLEGT